MTSTIYYLLWAALFFVMMRFGCGAHVMGHGHHRGHAGADDGKLGDMTSPSKATDPVCGMTVETAAAKSSLYDRRVYYFCSQNCREKFEAVPESYAKSARGASPQKEHHHGCC
jgi:YHS domain-containing protein